MSASQRRRPLGAASAARVPPPKSTSLQVAIVRYRGAERFGAASRSRTAAVNSVRRRLPGATVGPGPSGGSVSWLVAGCVLRSAGDVTWLIGVSARSGEPAALHDQVLIADRPVLKPAFEDLAGACGVACLRRQRRAGDVRGHAMVWHSPPRVILRRGLGEPDIAGVAGELAAFQRAADRVAV